jgi:hypothetical protein
MWGRFGFQPRRDGLAADCGWWLCMHGGGGGSSRWSAGSCWLQSGRRSRRGYGWRSDGLAWAGSNGSARARGATGPADPGASHCAGWCSAGRSGGRAGCRGRRTRRHGQWLRGQGRPDSPGATRGAGGRSADSAWSFACRRALRAPELTQVVCGPARLSRAGPQRCGTKFPSVAGQGMSRVVAQSISYAERSQLETVRGTSMLFSCTMTGSPTSTVL